MAQAHPKLADLDVTHVIMKDGAVVPVAKLQSILDNAEHFALDKSSTAAVVANNLPCIEPLMPPGFCITGKGEDFYLEFNLHCQWEPMQDVDEARHEAFEHWYGLIGRSVCADLYEAREEAEKYRDAFERHVQSARLSHIRRERPWSPITEHNVLPWEKSV